MRPLRQNGFTLVEMIIVIVITGIIAGSIAVFIARPVQGFIDLSRRATLVYSAESAIRRMQRDVHRALPNSIRVAGGGTALEIINTVAGARYRSAPPPGNPNNRLEFGSPDTDFDVLGNLDDFISAGVYRVSIYNTGDVDGGGAPVPGLNAYAVPDAMGRNVITTGTVNITNSGNEDHIAIPGGFQFTANSPNNRLYLVDTAISYICSGGQLLRYSGYNFTNAVQPVPPGVAPIVMADNVANCVFTYTPGTSQRAGLLTLDLSVTDAGTGETVRLLHQVHVDNVP